jgi:hypothetical protein
MRFRKLRIAWSVGCGIACVLLIVLWLRSYHYFDKLEGPIGSQRAFDIVSFPGQLDLDIWRFIDQPHPWSRRTYPLSELPAQGIVLPAICLGFYSWDHQEYFGIRLPYWFLSTATAILVPAPWLKRRFSLRTLLIATTLVAVVLGLVCYAVR